MAISASALREGIISKITHCDTTKPCVYACITFQRGVRFNAHFPAREIAKDTVSMSEAAWYLPSPALC